MRFNLSLQHKGLILVTVPVIFGAAFMIVLSHLLNQANAEIDRQTSSKLIVAEAGNLQSHLLQAGICLAMYKSLHAETLIHEYDRVVSEVPDIYTRMQLLTKSRKGSGEDVRKLEECGNSVLYLTSNFRRPTDPTEFYLHSDVQYRTKFKQTYDQFVQSFHSLEKHEAAFQETQSDQLSRMRIAQFLWLAAGCNLLLAWGLSIFFSRSITRRLTTLTDNNFRLARRQPLNELVKGSDEIAVLDQGFHNMAAALLRAEQRKQEFVQMISHDLRTPLSSIQGTLALALRGTYGTLNDKGASRLSDAEADSERLIDMINELLDIEKIEAGKLDLDCSECRMSEAVQRSLESVRPFAESHRVALTYDGSDATVNGDKDRLIRVLINLLSNAVKYSEAATAVSVRVEQQSTTATVKVIDSGRGVPQACAEKIFDRFAQVERTDAEKGTGLGLAICKAIIEAHGGKIGVSSNEGGGSTFWFSLDLVADSDATASGAPLAGAATTPAGT